jgi:hypothetical protein
MEIIQILVTVMVVTILATITLAAVSYGAFKARERRIPEPGPGGAAPSFFERVRFVADEPATQAAADD